MGERLKHLKDWRDQRGGEMGVDPALVCTNAQAKTLALSNPHDPDDIKAWASKPGLGIKNWQREQFGMEICGLLKEWG